MFCLRWRTRSVSGQPGWVLGSNQVEGQTPSVGLHGVVEPAESRFAGIALFSTPVHGKTDGQPSEHGKIPGGLQGANPTLVLQRNHVETLMRTVLDAPITAFVAK